MQYIIEICVAIDIAIMGIAYPIIVDKTSNIGDKYSSEYISVLFNYEFPQKPLRLTVGTKQYTITWLKVALYATLFSFLLLIFQFPPPFGWNNWFINNSANLIVTFLTMSVTILFFVWLDKVVLYSGRSKPLLTHLVANYHRMKDQGEVRTYHLKAINELTFYAVDKQDEHLQQTLLEFYSQVFHEIRQTHDKVIPLVYPIDLYFLVNKLNFQVTTNENRKLRALEHRAASGAWMLGPHYDEISISNDTYSWLWRNLYMVCDHERLVRMFWANSSQYFDYRLSGFALKRQDISSTADNETGNETLTERDTFLEFHIALGGLLLYRKQHGAIHYCLTYTQSQPPRYPLLPFSMKSIFEWFEHFRNEFSSIGTPIDTKYYFPELDHLGNRTQVIYWICRYLALLFIRQFTLHTYYVFEHHTAQPALPNNVIELNNWLDTVDYFERCMRANLADEELTQTLRFTETVKKNSHDIETFLQTLRARIKEEIVNKKYTAELSERKIQTFFQSSNAIISEAFETYNKIFNPLSAIAESDLKIPIRGANTTITKSAFTDNDTPHLNYDSWLAGRIADEIKSQIPRAFTSARTRRYLLNKENLPLALERIVDSNPDVVIISIGIDFEVAEILDQSRFAVGKIDIPSTDHAIQNTLFVLKKTDLPALEHKDLDESEQSKYKLKPLNKQLKLYASVIDMSEVDSHKMNNNWDSADVHGNIEFQVQLHILFHSVIHWKIPREIIQVELATQYKEQGIENALNEIKPLRAKDNA